MEKIRWKQRFENLEKAFKKLELGLKIFDYREYLKSRRNLRKKLENAQEEITVEELERLDLDREGIIQRFEYCFELFLLTLKDYLENSGEAPEELSGKRTILKNALQKNLIQDHDSWRKMLIARNLTSHTYNEEIADEVTENIVKIYFPLMNDLYAKLKTKYNE